MLPSSRGATPRDSLEGLLGGDTYPAATTPRPAAWCRAGLPVSPFTQDGDQMPTNRPIRRERIEEMLEERNITFKDVMAEFECTYRREWDALHKLHAVGGCHVVAWAVPVGGGKAIPVYAPGPGEDLPRPRAATEAERGKIWRYRRAWGRTAAEIDRQLAERVANIRASCEADVRRITEAATAAKRAVQRHRKERGTVPLTSAGVPSLADQLKAML